MRRRVCMRCRAAVAADFRVAVLRIFLEIRVCCFWRMSLVCAVCALCAACIGVIRAHSVPEGAYTCDSLCSLCDDDDQYPYPYEMMISYLPLRNT